MERVCFTLHVDPARIDAYVAAHAAVWPQMLEAIADAGRRNYTLFLRPDGLLVGYYETDDDAASAAALVADPRTTEWEVAMAPYFVTLEGERADASAPHLTEIFNLAEQLAGIRKENQ